MLKKFFNWVGYQMSAAVHDYPTEPNPINRPYHYVQNKFGHTTTGYVFFEDALYDNNGIIRVRFPTFYRLDDQAYYLNSLYDLAKKRNIRVKIEIY